MSKGTFYIETYGCQMNEHDSEKMSALLENLGHTGVSSADAADVVVINTCSIREKAEHKVYSALGKLKSLKKRNATMVIVVAGCVAQQEKEKLLHRAPHLDLVLGTHSIGRLPGLLDEIRQSRKQIDSTEFSADVESLHTKAPLKGRNQVCSYVTIMQGCSNFCSYCVVPFTRGPEQSRPLAEVVDEAQDLVKHGVKEITLLGQNVNAYGKDLKNGTLFTDLLRELDRIPGLSRTRFTTSHPRDFNDDTVEAMAELGSVCEHIHLPLQSGSDRILRAMNRGYTFAEYLDKVRRLRERVPHVAVTTDIIVGFPGETEADFEDTKRALQTIRFDQIFSFKFSPRPGTGAGRFPDQVPEDVKARRLEDAHAIQDKITLRYHQEAEGAIEEALVEGIRNRTGQPFGRTRTNKIVNLNDAEGVQEGDLLKVKIVRGLKHSLLGSL